MVAGGGADGLGQAGVGGTVLQTSLDHTREDALRKALSGDHTAPVI